MPIVAVWIINRSGSLIYQRAFQAGHLSTDLTPNDYLVMASTFQSLHAISTQLDPKLLSSDQRNKTERRGAVETVLLGRDGLQMHCLQTPTGLKFVLITSGMVKEVNETLTLSTGNAQNFLGRLWEVYAECAGRNVWQVPGMPLKSDLFESQLAKLVLQSTKNI